MQAVINVAIAPLTTNPALWAQNPQQSRLVDELLLGMPVKITGEAEQHIVPVRTFYGYTGWVAQDALLTGPKAEEWLVQPQMVVIARWADVLAEPRVQGACVAAGLPLGARVAVQGEPEDGWQAVTLPDGRTGYLRADALAPLYTQPCEQDQEKLQPLPRQPSATLARPTAGAAKPRRALTALACAAWHTCCAVFPSGGIPS